MSDIGYTLKVFRQIGMMKPILPHRIIGAGLQLAKWGPGFPSGVNAAAKRFPNQLAIIDDEGEITWSELSEQINQLTQALKDRGIEPGDSVALLCRNHRYMVHRDGRDHAGGRPGAAAQHDGQRLAAR